MEELLSTAGLTTTCSVTAAENTLLHFLLSFNLHKSQLLYSKDVHSTHYARTVTSKNHDCSSYKENR